MTNLASKLFLDHTFKQRIANHRFQTFSFHVRDILYTTCVVQAQYGCANSVGLTIHVYLSTVVTRASATTAYCFCYGDFHRSYMAYRPPAAPVFEIQSWKNMKKLFFPNFKKVNKPKSPFVSRSLTICLIPLFIVPGLSIKCIAEFKYPVSWI